MTSRLLLWISITLLCACDKADITPAVSQQALLPYQNPTLAREQRVADLINRMSLSEKISQLYNESPAIPRLGVAEYNWWNEALHGVARAGKATVFPQAIGMAASFDEAMMFDIATAISDEARAKHHYFVREEVVFRYTGLTFWSPNVNIFRDPRWGRGQETYGEDPYLTTRMALPFIKGLQGEDPLYLKTAAMVKHFAVHSGPEKTRHSDDYHANKKDLFETYLPAFENAVRLGGVESVMCAYNRVNGDPACGNDFLLKELLREAWQFKGHVVSDCGAIADFYDPLAHNLVPAPAQAAAWALKSGTDLNCGTQRLSTYANLHFALQRKMVDESLIDQALTRLFNTRFKLGMFDADERVPFAAIPMSVVGDKKHLSLAEKAAEKAYVLLKNDGLLPLKKNQKVALIGPNANNQEVLLGNYHGTPIHPITALDGLRAYLGEANVSYAPGTALVDDFYTHYELVPAEVLSHRKATGEEAPGLEADYFLASVDEGRAQEASFSRIDPQVDFYWPRSPVDNKVRGEFGIVWQGILRPSEDGDYQFRSEASIFIDGENIKAPIHLKRGQAYALRLERNFVRSWSGNPIEAALSFSWLNRSRDLEREALRAAADADVIIFAGGISPAVEGEEMKVQYSGFDYGDRIKIDLPSVQRELLKKLKKLGKPIIMVNFSGSAVALNWEDENLNAIVQGFYPGEAGGKALANLLWGEYSPSAKLPVTFYRGVEDLPDFKNYSMQGRSYKYYEGAVLYPFGHGLTYATLTYSDFKIDQSGDKLVLSVHVSNQSAYDADDVLQVYMSEIPRLQDSPLRSLLHFQTIKLPASANRTFRFEIDKSRLSQIDEQGKPRNLQGTVLFSAGNRGANASGALQASLPARDIQH